MSDSIFYHLWLRLNRHPHQREVVVVRNFLIVIEVGATAGWMNGPLKPRADARIVQTEGWVYYSHNGWTQTPHGNFVPSNGGMSAAWMWDLQDSLQREYFQEYIDQIAAGKDFAPTQPSYDPDPTDTTTPDIDDSAPDGGGDRSPSPEPEPDPDPDPTPGGGGEGGPTDPKDPEEEEEDNDDSDPPANSLYIEYEVDEETGEMVPAAPYRGFPIVMWLTGPSSGQFTTVAVDRAAEWVAQGKIDFEP